MKAITRVYEYLTYKGINPKKFEEINSLSNGYLGKQKKRNANLGEEVFNKILDNCPDINAEWLLTGIGDMIKNENQQEMRDPVSVYSLRTDQSSVHQKIPLYNIEASAGLVELFRHHNDEEAIDTISIPNLPKCDGAIYVTGDSMYPLLKSGDIIMYKEIHNILDGLFWGEMYLISIEMDGEEFISVKYIQKSDKGDQYIKLVSQNSHHQPREVKLDRIKALALVKASIRINSMH